MSTVKYIIFDFDGNIADTIDLALSMYDKIAPAYNCKPINVKDINELDFRKSKDLFKEYGITNVKQKRIFLKIKNTCNKHNL